MIIKVKDCGDCPFENSDIEQGGSCNLPEGPWVLDYPYSLPDDCPLRSGAVVVMLDEGLDSLDKQLKS